MRKPFYHTTLFFIFLIIHATSTTSRADNLSKDQRDAMNDVMKMLTNPSARQENLKNDKSAQESDRIVKELGGEYSEEIYQLAAKIMENLVQQAQGDPKKMEQILEKARKDPAAFANTFTDEQKSQLKDLGKKIESKKGKTLP